MDNLIYRKIRFYSVALNLQINYWTNRFIFDATLPSLYFTLYLSENTVRVIRYYYYYHIRRYVQLLFNDYSYYVYTTKPRITVVLCKRI